MIEVYKSSVEWHKIWGVVDLETLGIISISEVDKNCYSCHAITQNRQLVTALVKNRKNHKTTLAQYISFKIISFKIILFKREYNSSFWGSLCLVCFLRKQTQKRKCSFHRIE